MDVLQGSSQYMDTVGSKFFKNFDKFDLYMRRNIVTVPHDLADNVEALFTARLQAKQRKCEEEQKEHDAEEETMLQNAFGPSLSREEQQETQLARELSDLRRELRQVS